MRTYRAWRGVKSLVHDAVSATTNLVGEGHDSTGRTTVKLVSLVPTLAAPVSTVNGVRKVGTDGILASVRGVNRVVEFASDVALNLAGEREGELAPVVQRSDAMGTQAWVGDALLGAVNGVVGDHLARKGNPLDLGLSLRVPERFRSHRIVVLVHGVATTEWSWSLDAARLLGDPAANFGTLLQRDLGLTPVFARYNSGRHISENGRALSHAIESLWSAEASGETPEIILLGHSMGGLVSRSATIAAREAGHSWLHSLRRIVCLGSPHQGAPLERFGHRAARLLERIDLPHTRIPAAIIQARSQGIKDLRHGDITDAGWQGIDQDAREPGGPAQATDLLDQVSYAFIAGSITKNRDNPVATVLGDLLVQVPSAQGPRRSSITATALHATHHGGVKHHEIQVHPAVYEQVRRFCAGEWDHAPGNAL